MKAFLFLVPLCFALPASCLFILLPLYVYPGTDASAWSPVTSAIAAAPTTVKWQIIINPDSGPGSTQYPDSNYITGISQLNSYSNVKTLGYVDTDYTNVASTTIQSQIDTYAGWADYTGADIGMDGIFFDQVTSGTTSADYTYMENAANYAYDHIPTDKTYVVFNPGDPSPTQYFDYADTLIQFEGTYANYAGQTTINSFPEGYLDQSAIVIHDTPTTVADVHSPVDTMFNEGIKAVYYTYDCCYNSLSLTLLNALASAVANV